MSPKRLKVTYSAPKILGSAVSFNAPEDLKIVRYIL